jgi:hypothetical protein
MGEVSLFRLNLLRAGYLLLVVGLGLTVWPSILNLAKSWELMQGVVVAMLGAMGLLALLGLRYPLAMLPLLFFEVIWKAIWLLRVALPLWNSHRMDAATTETAYECLLAVIFLIIIPWPYVFANYVRKSGDPWLRRAKPLEPA